MRKALVAIPVGLLVSLFVGVAGALIWFPAKAIIDFKPQNITVGWPGNPPIPAGDQRTDLILDSLVFFVFAAVFLGMAIIVGKLYIDYLRDR